MIYFDIFIQRQSSRECDKAMIMELNWQQITNCFDNLEGLFPNGGFKHKKGGGEHTYPRTYWDHFACRSISDNNNRRKSYKNYRMRKYFYLRSLFTIKLHFDIYHDEFTRKGHMEISSLNINDNLQIIFKIYKLNQFHWIESAVVKWWLDHYLLQPQLG